MKFAHFTQTFPRPGETAADRFELIWRELELADEVDFDFGFASIHHFSRLRPQASAYCTAAAARTRRIRVGAMGYTVPLYDPIRIVEEVAVLDNITHGRLEVGLAAGVNPEEFRIYRGDFDNRRAIATEAMQLLKRAFSGENPFDFDGPFHKYKEVSLAVEPLQRPHPPIWLLSVTPELLRSAAKEGVHTGYIFFRPRQEAAPHIEEYLQIWRAQGHSYAPNVSYLAFVFVDETDEAAVANGAPHILNSMETIYGRALGGGRTPQAGDLEGTPDLGNAATAENRKRMYDFSYLDEHNLVFVGSPETVVRKLKAAAEEGLFNVFCGEFNVGTVPEEDLMRSIRLFGTEVIPALKDFDPTIAYLSQAGDVASRASVSE